MINRESVKRALMSLIFLGTQAEGAWANKEEGTSKIEAQKVVGSLFLDVFSYLTKEEKETLAKLVMKGSERRYLSQSKKER